MSGGNPSGRGGRPNQSLGLPRPYKEGEDEKNQEKLEPPKKRLKKDKMNKQYNGGNNGMLNSSASSSDNETNGVNGDHRKDKRKMGKRDQVTGLPLSSIMSNSPPKHVFN